MHKTAALYCRVSTTGQEDNYSLVSQLNIYGTYAEQHGHRVDEAHLHRDVASGFALDRPGLDALRAGLSQGKVQPVIVDSYDCWPGRNVDLYLLYHQLSAAGWVRGLAAAHRLMEYFEAERAQWIA